ncbi:flagellar basal body rod protein FlgC [Piscirickettsia salmonis]|uniref:flagellar basal body rod protein FlgC n=1 Tax=Piscirickettsia salmonis TaxID=1238 RepID=UPI00047FECCC|nr:flagellar basal body rod protein FlgC [Piscirickettsia salmonis]AKP74207.2 flagellar basal-body rod protein FlgC [Piscirickettsia salmonis LF-89 = ATCC VR-1361]ALY03034.1 flagellar basal-body rod protein FlgC [Piscirickettsia salmonis]AMA42592.1 flagellar basal-body rod protein FlgC [Piscirickettsia salmonis]AOS35062.1 flagellar basal-body rod protein FlgC [Piscirickettsia salmonis]APS59771.1 flagellar basal-body rod protein FlgC [Piscirickettsia salmonis]
MFMFSVFEIAGSAMMAQSIRLNTTASNLANINSVSSSIDTTYRSRQPVFAPIAASMRDEFFPNRAPGRGVQVLGIVESDAPLEQRFDPDHPMANEEGYIFLPNVNPVEAMVNMISASQSYRVNVEAFNTSKQLMQQTLRLAQQ